LQENRYKNAHPLVSVRLSHAPAAGKGLLRAGYENANYFDTISGFTATRNDDYYYIEPSADMNVTRYWSVGGYYPHRQDTSSFVFFSFYDNHFGLSSSANQTGFCTNRGNFDWKVHLRWQAERAKR
jgi:hypothetical protein